MHAHLDIVLPCYNPGPGWHEELLAFHSYISKGFNVSYIVVNDGSTVPGIGQSISGLESRGVPVTYLEYKTNMGKGYALRHGVSHARSPIVLYTDIDFPFTNDSMGAVIDKICSGTCDLAVGYRSEAYYQEKMTRFRKILSKGFRFFLRRVLRMQITDTQCGLKAFNEKGKAAFLRTRTKRYLFDFEFIYSCSGKSGITLATVPVRLKENVVFSRMRPAILLQETWNLLGILLFRRRYRP